MSASREHWQALSLKNGGNRIRRLKSSGADIEINRANQRDLLRNAASFVAQLVGSEALPNYHPGDNVPEIFAWYLNILKPLFPGQQEFDFWPYIIDEVARMPFGDDPEILVPEKKMPGQPKQPGLLAFRRLRALEWGVFFKARGVRASDFQAAISLCFATDWDAIRHWQGSISKVIGAHRVYESLSFADRGYFIEHRDWHRSISEPLFFDGELYRLAKGIPAMSQHVIDSDWEKLKPKLSIPMPEG